MLCCSWRGKTNKKKQKHAVQQCRTSCIHLKAKSGFVFLALQQCLSCFQEDKQSIARTEVWRFCRTSRNAKGSFINRPVQLWDPDWKPSLVLFGGVISGLKNWVSLYCGRKKQSKMTNLLCPPLLLILPSAVGKWNECNLQIQKCCIVIN